MTLRDLDRQEAFALLGPGYGDGRFLLLQGLADVGASRDATASAASAAQGPLPFLVFAAWETPGREARVLRPATVTRDVPAPAPGAAGVPVRFDDRGIRDAVETIREAIAAGDVYQVCFTVRAALEAPSGADILAAMCAEGVPRYAAWVRLPGGPEFVSASPECFFEIRDGIVRSEPMKGTAGPADADLLAGSAKDGCELAMITDLVRNDLVPVCRPRSVRVPCERRALGLPYAVQAVSDVAGDLREGAGPLEVLDALHPGGSVTGAPKAAARDLVRRLEATPRGPYCGALGWVDGDRSTFGLLIRTATRTGTGWTYGVGSGIVYDSDPDREVEEFRIKLGALGCVSPRCS